MIQRFILNCSKCGTQETLSKDPTGVLHACSNDKCGHVGKARPKEPARG